MVKTKWLASLNNGTIAIEGVAPFEDVVGEDSPWRKFQKYLEKEKLYITGLRIQVEKTDEATKTYNLPSFNCKKNGIHEKWLITPITPVSYTYCRRVRRSLTTSITQKYIQIIAEYKDFNVSILIDEDNGNESWTVIHE